MKTRMAFWAAITGALCVAGCAMFGGRDGNGAKGASESSQTGTGAGESDEWDESVFELSLEDKVVSLMHGHGDAMIELGELAMRKGASQEVRSFGHRLATDHQFANHRLFALARAEHILIGKIPEPPPSPEQELSEEEVRDTPRKNDADPVPSSEPGLSDLAEMRGEEFDRLFILASDQRQRRIIRELAADLPKLESDPVRRGVERLTRIFQQNLSLSQHLREKRRPERKNTEPMEQGNEPAQSASAR